MMPCEARLGKLPALQLTKHEHEPSALMVPVPDWMPLPVLALVVPVASGSGLSESVPVLPVLGSSASGDDAAGWFSAGAAGAAAGGAAAGEPPVMALCAPLPFCWMAMAWNIACVLAADGLMEKVMPLPQ